MNLLHAPDRRGTATVARDRQVRQPFQADIAKPERHPFQADIAKPVRHPFQADIAETVRHPFQADIAETARQPRKANVLYFGTVLSASQRLGTSN